MSGYLQGQVWFRDVRGSERDVLLALADHADDNGERIYPSMEYLAWKVGISKRQTQRLVSSLRDRGALIVVRESTRYDPTHYCMKLSALPLKASFEHPESDVTPASPLSEAGVTSGDVRGDTQTTPETSLNRHSSGAKAPSRVESDPNATRLCRLLADLMRANDPKAKLPQAGTTARDRWIKDMRLLVADRDGDVSEVERVIRWCQSDDFEQTVVLSPAKLRKRFSQLWLKTQQQSSDVTSTRPQALDRADEWKQFYPEEAA